VQNLLGADLMANWVQYTPPRPYAAIVRWYSRSKLADPHAPPLNVVVSNVPGPRVPLYAGGARLLELYSVGPILEGIGVNVTVWSYLDHLFVGVIGCPETLPDSERITEGMTDALAELVALVPGAAAGAATGAARAAV
jgi:diacylglycerol O-acyltransferase